ncbi:4-alpha-glucanotransferase [Anaerolentibacter hominis]|uniref:4-alpha-glucanotransferase n=1 Tax=Anaerolentibacter hominis TaxID=3079009 RepID=UPI0031B83E21
MKEKERGAGILLPVSSLPSPYGIGTIGKAAFEFADQLAAAGQKYWQVLPVGPTSYGDSPYQSFSAFAGNPYYIDLDFLAEEGLLKKNELEQDWGEREDHVDYELLFSKRFAVLKKAFLRSKHRNKSAYLEFEKAQEAWLDDYALYMAVKEKFGHKEWAVWDEGIRLRKPESLKHYKRTLAGEIEFWKFCQFKFYTQWKKLKTYVNGLGIRIIGDIPLYVAYDSADVWTHGDLFELDERKKPIHVAGVPPDYFSSTGQRWGNPLYDWEAMEDSDFAWWRLRMKTLKSLYDVIRIDHFIGIVRYYSIPAGHPTAQNGTWRPGPGSKLTKVIKESIGGETEIIAEDLGVVSKGVRRLMKQTGWPGMKILLFGFDGTPDSEYLPHNYKSSNLVVYGGTHDNEPIAAYFKNMRGERLKEAKAYLGVGSKRDFPDAMIKLGYSTIADTVIFQMQDILHLGAESRMNLPGKVGGWWRWRMDQNAFDTERQRFLLDLTGRYNR